MAKIRQEDLHKPSVMGVGFVGDGVHKPCITIDGKKKNTAAYEVWRGIMRRCYDKKWQKSKRPTYEGCSVSEVWHNFQNFANWYYEHKHFGLGYHLDKDLTKIGNKEYGPDTCDLIPVEVNSFYTGSKSFSTRGVHFCNNKKKFIVQCHVNGRQNYYGAYDSEEKAREAYRIAKTKQFENLVSRYGEVLSEAVKNNLRNMIQ